MPALDQPGAGSTRHNICKARARGTTPNLDPKDKNIPKRDSQVQPALWGRNGAEMLTKVTLEQKKKKKNSKGNPISPVPDFGAEKVGTRDSSSSRSSNLQKTCGMWGGPKRIGDAPGKQEITSSGYTI